MLPMLPYALCSNPRCSYSIELHDRIKRALDRDPQSVFTLQIGDHLALPQV
jgi:hypothetical protein